MRRRSAYIYDGRDYDTDEIMFVDFDIGDYETGFVISADYPELATVSLGIGMIFLTLRLWRVKVQLRHSAVLIPVPVEITAFGPRRGVRSITYNDKIANNQTGRSSYTRMKNGEEPVIFGSASGKSVGLAVRHGRKALPVLRDNRLQRVSLKDIERMAALAPFANEPGNG
ncbi:hypothetical protein G6L88_20550 [Rhizobium skierniewicense]|nr:hypothetical protein [Rhizobium skierniewicense]